MNIFVLQTGEPLQCDKANRRAMRGINLTNAFVEKEHEVTFISSSFCHQDKKHRSNKLKTHHINKFLKIVLIPSPGYKKNISIKRLYDHFVLSINLFNYLRSLKSKPDLIFIGYPPIETSAVIIWWAKSKGIQCYLDIKDKWPHYFLTKIPRKIKPIARILLFPYFKLAKYSMKNATALVSMSASFLEWAQSFAKRKNNKLNLIMPLSPPKNQFFDTNNKDIANWWEAKVPSLSAIPTFSFIGTISEAFDFEIIKEVALLMNKNNKKCNFVICGEGQEFEKTKRSFKDLKNTFFPGWINTQQINYLMNISLATLAPYKNESNFTDNLPNKILDSLSFGKPIITSLKGEVEQLIKLKEVGLFCENNPYSWYLTILLLIENNSLTSKLSLNSKRIFSEVYSYEKVYENFVNTIEKI